MFDFLKKRIKVAGREIKKLSKRFASGVFSRFFAFRGATSGSADLQIKKDFRSMRNRSRELARDNDYFRRFVNLYIKNVIGASGINPQSKLKTRNGDLKDEINSLIEKKWRIFSRKENFSPSGTLSYWQTLRMVTRLLTGEGECFVEIIFSEDLKNPIKFAVIDSDLVADDYDQSLANGNIVKMGVEKDPIGRIIAYWVYTSNPYEYILTKGSRKLRRILAEDIIHIFDMERPDQTRGFTISCSAMRRLDMINGYEESEMVAARIASAQMGVIEHAAEGGWDGRDTEEDPEIALEPGSFPILPKGYKMNMFKPEHPHSSISAFIKTLLRGVASGLGLSYPSLASDLEGVNYSSIRQGVLDDRDNYRDMQRLVIEQFCEPVFMLWIRTQIAFGGIPANIFSDEFLDSMNLEWSTRGWQWVDPLKEIKAHKEALSANIETLKDILSQRGQDVEDHFRQLKHEDDLARKYLNKTLQEETA